MINAVALLTCRVKKARFFCSPARNGVRKRLRISLPKREQGLVSSFSSLNWSFPKQECFVLSWLAFFSIQMLSFQLPKFQFERRNISIPVEAHQDGIAFEPLTLKAPNKIAADDTLIFSLLSSEENKA